MSVRGAFGGCFGDTDGVSFEGVLIGLLALEENKLLPSLPPEYNSPASLVFTLASQANPIPLLATRTRLVCIRALDI
eukprot:scaffold25735_cov65-Skeletonema_dohrnii-CCMP3373.AAC.1